MVSKQCKYPFFTVISSNPTRFDFIKKQLFGDSKEESFAHCSKRKTENNSSVLFLVKMFSAILFGNLIQAFKKNYLNANGYSPVFFPSVMAHVQGCCQIQERSEIQSDGVVVEHHVSSPLPGSRN